MFRTVSLRIFELGFRESGRRGSRIGGFDSEVDSASVSVKNLPFIFGSISQTVRT